MGNFLFGAAWIVMGLIWLRRGYAGLKAGAVVTLAARPEDLLMHKRDRTLAVVTGTISLGLGVAEILTELIPR